MARHAPLAVTVREAVEVLRRLEPALFQAWPSAKDVGERGLEQRVRRLEKRGVMKPARRGSGPLDQYLFDETALVSARLYLRLLEGGMRLSHARNFVDYFEASIRDAVEQGLDVIAWSDRSVTDVTPRDQFARLIPAQRLPYVTAIPLRDLVTGVQRELRAIRRKRPTIMANGRPTTVAKALPPTSGQGRRGQKKRRG